MSVHQAMASSSSPSSSTTEKRRPKGSATSCEVGKVLTTMPASSMVCSCVTSVNGTCARDLEPPAVPAVAITSPPKWLQKTGRPRTWSECSCVTITCVTRSMSQPTASARRSSSRREMPQSIRTLPAGPSTTAALPFDPLASTCRCILGVMLFSPFYSPCGTTTAL